MRFFALAALALATTAAHAEPIKVTWQGRMIDSLGHAVNGDQLIRLSVWDDDTASDPSNLRFQEDFSTHIEDGYATLIMGMNDDLGRLDFAGDVWIGVTVHPTDLSLAVEMAPRSIMTDDPRGAAPESTETSCKGIKAASPTAVSQVYEIDPDGEGGNAPFDVYCDMVTDGGGWTYLGHLDNTHLAPALFSSDIGTYNAQRTDGGSTYSIGASLLQHIDQAEMMVLLDNPEAATAAAAAKLIIYEHAVGAAAFNSGPIPCTSSPFTYRLSPTGTSETGSFYTCNTTRWYPDANDTAGTHEAHLALVIGSHASVRGTYWGAGMGGDNSWTHDGYFYVR